jgi:hypothetical protein
MRKTIIAAMLAASATAFANPTDFSLSTGDWSSVSGQTLTGPQTFQAGPNAWAISPYTGSTMYSLAPQAPSNTYANMATALGMSAASVSALSAEIAAQNPQGGGNITNAAWVSKDFTFTSAASFKMYWTYTSTDYVPFNDGSITTLVNTGDATTLGKINGVTTQYLLLGATNPGTGNYSTDSYGSTGWQVVNYNVLSAGTYKLGFGIFNQGDTALSPVLNVNDGLGTVTKNGTTFGSVAPNDPTMPTVDPTPTGPTVVSTTTADSVSSSTSNGTATIATSIAYGATASIVNQANSKGDQTPKVLNVVQTTTVTQTTPFTLTQTTTTPVTTTTVTTPVTTKTWSDGTTTTENGTPVTTTSVANSVTSTDTQGQEIIEAQSQQNYTTRIDQYAQMQKQNSRLNASLDSDTLSRFKVTENGLTQRTEDDRDWNFYLNATGSNSNTSDSYKYDATTYGLGFEKKIDSNTLVGIQYNRIYSTTAGEQGGGNLSKDAVGVYALKKIDDFLLKGDVGYSVNKYNAGHNLPELGLSNWSSANGVDKWIAVRAYAPETKGFRPYIGARVENNQRNATVDSGSEVSAATYSALNSTKSTGLVGVRYEKELADKLVGVIDANVNSAQLNTVSASAIYAAKNNSSIIAKVTRQEQNGLVSNQAMILGRVTF